MSRLLFALVVALGLPATAHAASDEEKVRQFLHGMFDKPQAALSLDAVVIEAGYALADWSQDQTGGRAFLRRKGEDWLLILCAGDEIRAASALAQIGVPQPHAEALAQKLAQAERSVPPARLSLISSFNGIVRMDEHPHDSAKD
jgi:hypothetical protein